MTWQPISEPEIWDRLNASCRRMSAAQSRYWDVICIDPEKWEQHPYGDRGQGFWAVAVIGRIVVWYNDIEDGFNRSRYRRYDEIGEYWCNQDELEWVVQELMERMRTGYDIGGRAGPPEPLIG